MTTSRNVLKCAHSIACLCKKIFQCSQSFLVTHAMLIIFDHSISTKTSVTQVISMQPGEKHFVSVAPAYYIANAPHSWVDRKLLMITHEDIHFCLLIWVPHKSKPLKKKRFCTKAAHVPNLFRFFKKLCQSLQDVFKQLHSIIPGPWIRYDKKRFQYDVPLLWCK